MGVFPHIFFPPPHGAGVTLVDLLEPIRALLAGLHFDLVDLTVGGSRERPSVRVRFEHADDPARPVSADDCSRASRAIEAALDEAQLLGPAYELEVSSPGIERPLRFARHWRRFIGARVRIRAAGIAGRQEVVVVAVPDDEHVTVRDAQGTETTLGLGAVREAVVVVDWKQVGKRQGA